MKALSRTFGALGALGVVLATSFAQASSHREAPAISNDPAADNTDLYAWVQGSNLIIVANYIPLQQPAGGPNFNHFSDEVLYEVKIARGAADLIEDLTYQIKFTQTAFTYNDPGTPDPTPAGGQEFFSQIAGGTRTYSVTKVEGGVATELVSGAPVAPPNIGPRTNAIAYGVPNGQTYEQHFVGGAGNVITSLGTGQGRVFAGPRDDPFYVDLGAVFDLAGLCPVLGCTPKDNVAGFNVHSIVLEIPLDVVNGGAVTSGAPSNDQTVGVWATASRKKMKILRGDGTADTYGPWVQVSRLGFPLVNEAIMGIQDKDRYNRTHPKDDVANFGAYILNPVVVRDAEFAGFYAAGGPLAGVAGQLDSLKTNRLDVVAVLNLNDIPSAGAHNIGLESTGDVLRVDLGIPSGFPNGRPINPGGNSEQGDVTDIALSLLLTADPGAGVGDGISTNDATFRADFPFLATPWEGAGQGIGVPAP